MKLIWQGIGNKGQVNYHHSDYHSKMRDVQTPIFTIQQPKTLALNLPHETCATYNYQSPINIAAVRSKKE